MKPYAKLIEVASFYVGVSEQAGKPNGGPNIEEFLASVNLGSGQPWCAAFVAFCVKKVEEELGVKSPLRLSGHVLTMWRNSRPQQRRLLSWQGAPGVAFPEPGWLVVWQKRGTSSGHIGIVESADQFGMTTIEGNTAPGASIVREGDGVFKKSRPYTDVGSMVLLGFLDPWSY